MFLFFMNDGSSMEKRVLSVEDKFKKVGITPDSTDLMSDFLDK